MDRIISNEELTLVLSIGSNASRQYYYYIVKKDTGEKVGTCGIRLGDVREIKYLGNIEYEIFEPYRGNKYAEKATRLLATIAIKHNIKELVITARPTNKASIRTIENLGAKFIEVINVPKNTRIYKESKLLSIYKWNLEGENKNDRHKIN